MSKDLESNDGDVNRSHFVAMVYDVLMHPEKIETLFGEMSTLYDAQLSSKAAAPVGPHDRLLLTLEGIESHLDKAATLFDTLGRKYRGDDADGAKADDVILVDRFGRVHAVTGAPNASAGSPGIASIFDLEIDSDAAKSLQAQLSALPRSPLLTVVPVYNRDGSRDYWALTGLREPRQNAVAELRRMKFGWSVAAGQVVVDAFGLTPSEADILRSVVDGKSLAELAKARERSIETVRTQAKSLLSKAGVRSQLELIRMFAAVSLAAPDAGPAAAGKAHDNRFKGNSRVRARDGREIPVEVCGPPAGRPVLFMHNLFGGPAMTAAVHAELERHNIRLICPWRPGYLDATRWKGPARRLPEIVANDAVAVMDSYGIERTIAVGHMSGSVHAAAMAALLPDRIAGTIAIAGFVPFLDRQQIDQMANWPRLYAYTARYVPTALAVLIRGTVALLREDKASVFFDGLFRTSPTDSASIADPELSRLYRGEFDRGMMNGSAGYELDAVLAASDWSQWLRRATGQPIQFVHGATDQITPREQLKYVAERLESVTSVIVPDAGSLLLFQKPALVIGLIDDLLRERVQD